MVPGLSKSGQGTGLIGLQIKKIPADKKPLRKINSFYICRIKSIKMSSLFLQQLLLSVVIAGIWIGGVTLLSERLGSRLGGMISNLPSTILVSLLFIGITQSPEFAAKATVTVPLGMTLSTLFLFAFIVFLPKGLVWGLTAGISTWLGLAILSSYFQEVGRLTWTVIYFVVATGTWLFSERVLKIASAPKTRRRYTWWQVLVRAVFAGSVVGTAVLIGRSGSAFWTGIFSTFPAVMLSSMVILTLSAGPAFARALGKIMLLASTNIIIYGHFSGYFFPRIGLAWGTILSFILATFWVWLLKPLFDRSK